MKLIAILAMTLLAGSSQAGIVNFAILSYDILEPPASGQAGKASINLQNLTGLEALPPDFGILNAIILENLELLITLASGQTEARLLGSLGPGVLTSAIEYPIDAEIESISLTGVFSDTDFALASGVREFAISRTFFVAMLPSAGPLLQPGVDFAVASAMTTSVPEPTMHLCVAIVAVGLGIRRLRP